MPRCSTAIRHTLVPWLDQLSSKWDCGFGSGLTKYQNRRGQRCNCLLWLVKIAFDAAGPCHRSLRLISFILLYFMCECVQVGTLRELVEQVFVRRLRVLPERVCLRILAENLESTKHIRLVCNSHVTLSSCLSVCVGPDNLSRV